MSMPTSLRALLGAALLAAALACTSSDNPPPAPVITSFSPTQTYATTGTSATLLAVFTGGTGVVDHGVGAVTSNMPAATGQLSANTTFTLTVTSANGTATTATAGVWVVPAPTITSFTSNGPVTADTPALLTAVFAGGTGLVNPGAMPIASGSPLNAGYLTVPTTFTLTVTNQAFTAVTATTTVSTLPSISVLDLTLAAPPTGASVRILGPGAFARTVTASTTLTSLAAGDYAIVPAGVWDGGQAWQATGARTLTLGQGATASATVSYAAAPGLVLQVPEVTQAGSVVELDLVAIPAGTFQMGAYAGEQDSVLEEAPQHAVTLSQPFYMAVFPTTQALWKAVTGTNPSYFSVAGKGSATDDLSRPVEFVSWNDLTAPGTGFLAKLNAAVASSLPAGMAFRLPTEAEWEYACRAGTTTRFFWGDDPGWNNLNLYAWWSGDSGATTHPVGGFGPVALNPFALADINGNVFEWCQDWFGPYTADAQSDPAGPPVGDYRVVRGGDWYLGGVYCRSANRSQSGPADANSEIGFRLVLAPAP